MTADAITTTDVVIFGGGVAGLWLLNRLRQQGYQAILLESQQLGAGQTRFAQGIIHGGTKYALTGKLTASAEAVGRMPAIWRACLEGQGEIDLRGVNVISPHQYMWSTTSLTSRLSGFFASRVMKSRTLALSKSERPHLFQHKDFRGQVYQLDEPVLDTSTLIRALAEPQRSAISHCDFATLNFEKKNEAIELNWQDNGQQFGVIAKQLVLCAGEGNEDLLSKLGKNEPRMQRRPLNMLMLRGMAEPLFAHCLGSGTVPRITITSHLDEKGWVWYLGGQLAEEGVQRSDQEQIKVAKQEMQTLLPWLDYSHCEWATLRVNRAEPLQPGVKRPDSAFVQHQKNITTVWPTKLALSPLAADMVLDAFAQAGFQTSPEKKYQLAEFPGYASLPWQEKQRWN